jgi:hypothetical protein
LYQLHFREQLEVSRDTLINRGFNFQYCTNYVQATDGHISYYCYDFGYVYLQDEIFKIIPAN